MSSARSVPLSVSSPAVPVTVAARAMEVARTVNAAARNTTRPKRFGMLALFMERPFVSVDIGLRGVRGVPKPSLLRVPDPGIVVRGYARNHSLRRPGCLA
jgi:hypothetical protein